MGGTGAIRGDWRPMLAYSNGFSNAVWEADCTLAGPRLFEGELGEFTVTSGGEQGAESEAVDTGRCSTFVPCCRGRGTGGPAVPRPRRTEAAPLGDDGESVPRTSSEARVSFGALS